MSTTTDAHNGGATLVHFDRENPPDSVVALVDAVQHLEGHVDAIKRHTDSPMDVRRVADLADRLESDASEVQAWASELRSAAEAANGLSVTTATAG